MYITCIKNRAVERLVMISWPHGETRVALNQVLNQTSGCLLVNLHPPFRIRITSLGRHTRLHTCLQPRHIAFKHLQSPLNLINL